MELMGVTVVRTIDGQYQSNIITTTITPIKATFYCHFIDPLPSGKLLHNYGKSQFLMGKLTISTGPFSIAILT